MLHNTSWVFRFTRQKGVATASLALHTRAGVSRAAAILTLIGSILVAAGGLVPYRSCSSVLETLP